MHLKPTIDSPFVFRKSFLYVLQPVLLVMISFSILSYFGSDIESWVRQFSYDTGIKISFKTAKILSYQEKIGKYIGIFVFYRFLVFLFYRIEVKNGRMIEVNYFSLNPRDATDFTKIDDINVDIRPWSIIFGLATVSFENRERGRPKNKGRDKISGLSLKNANQLFEVLSQNTADNLTEFMIKNKRS